MVVHENILKKFNINVKITPHEQPKEVNTGTPKAEERHTYFKPLTTTVKKPRGRQSKNIPQARDPQLPNA